MLSKQQKNILIKEHLGYNNHSIISSYSKPEVKENKTDNTNIKIVNESASDIQNISSLQKEMRGGRNIVVPKVAKNSNKVCIKRGSFACNLIDIDSTFEKHKVKAKSRLDLEK